jgi:hypothetical protein
MMDGEIWMPVIGYEGYYEVSNLGRVRSLDRITTSKDGRRRFWPGIMLKQKLRHHYLRTGLTKSGATTTWCVHRLVCEAFNGVKPQQDSVVRHLNGSHLDNRAENLRWGTPAENTADMIRHGRAYWANQTHCIRGHEFTPGNTRTGAKANGGSSRNCRECARIRSKSSDRNERRRVLPAARSCRVCSAAFESAYRQASFCSPECKRAARTVAFRGKRGVTA